jgi:hypothetical protein
MTLFANFQGFYEWVSNNNDIREGCGAVDNFCNAVEKINVGCGCQKKSRVARAERFYLALAHELSQLDKDLIKQKINNDGFTLKHKNSKFLVVE